MNEKVNFERKEGKATKPVARVPGSSTNAIVEGTAENLEKIDETKLIKHIIEWGEKILGADENLHEFSMNVLRGFSSQGKMADGSQISGTQIRVKC